MGNKHSYRVTVDNKRFILDDIEYNIHVTHVEDDPDICNIYIYSTKKLKPLIPFFGKAVHEYPFFLKNKLGFLIHCDSLKAKDAEWLNNFISEFIGLELQFYYKEEQFIKDLAGSI